MSKPRMVYVPGAVLAEHDMSLAVKLFNGYGEPEISVVAGAVLDPVRMRRAFAALNKDGQGLTLSQEQMLLAELGL